MPEGCRTLTSFQPAAPMSFATFADKAVDRTDIDR